MAADRLAGVFYCIQFERDPMLAVDRLVRMAEPDKGLGMTARELIDLIDIALKSSEPVSRFDMSERNIPEQVLRDFLAELRLRLLASMKP
jgi:hypothetical protein